MVNLRGILVVFCVFGIALCVPTRRDYINSAACSGVYHGRCIDTYQTQCMGLVIPGICGNMTHFSGIEVGGLTQLQCCNSWMNVDLSGTVVVGESTDGPFTIG